MPPKDPPQISKEDAYRILDGIYRIHDDLFHIEDELSRFASASLAVAKLKTNSFMGALAAGLLTIVPILMTVFDVTLTSAPVLAIAALVVGILVLWIYQAWSTRSTERKLGFIAGSSFRAPLERRHDYLLEIIATWGNRKRAIEDVILEIESRQLATQDEFENTALAARIKRYREISEQCLEWIKWAVASSAESLELGFRTPEENADILDWAQPFLVRGDDSHGREKGLKEGQ